MQNSIGWGLSSSILFGVMSDQFLPQNMLFRIQKESDENATELKERNAPVQV